MTRMMTTASRIAGVLALVVALTGASCSTMGTNKALVVSGETIAGIGDQFAALGGVYTKQCTPQISNPAFVSFCKSFKEYGPKFQTAYPLAVQTFKTAAAANDTAAAQGAEKTILQLATELTAIGGQALVTLGGK
jgi:hypothetical protein